MSAMRDRQATSGGQDSSARRAGARRTALALAFVALAVYAGFILIGVLSR